MNLNLLKVEKPKIYSTSFKEYKNVFICEIRLVSSHDVIDKGVFFNHLNFASSCKCCFTHLQT